MCIRDSFSSDGTDGPTDAAGGIVDGTTLSKLIRKNISIASCLLYTSGNDLQAGRAGKMCFCRSPRRGCASKKAGCTACFYSCRHGFPVAAGNKLLPDSAGSCRICIEKMGIRDSHSP